MCPIPIFIFQSNYSSFFYTSVHKQSCSLSLASFFFPSPLNSYFSLRVYFFLVAITKWSEPLHTLFITFIYSQPVILSFTIYEAPVIPLWCLLTSIKRRYLKRIDNIIIHKVFSILTHPIHNPIPAHTASLSASNLCIYPLTSIVLFLNPEKFLGNFIM